jgi:hypothetical protein
MLLVSAYPALLVGTVMGIVLGRRQWPVWPALAVGSVVLSALVAHQSTVPRLAGLPYEHPQITPLLWVLIGVVNCGSWALGIGIGIELNSRFGGTQVS